ncbi:ribonuclease P protein subunit p40-like isoform X1 [Acropora muricata]|uniref:ribonuclease P protein subunit p40-like isoform X1 n=1 Tax=Acropora muricata TaxID=159855 RepID=UPI0034E5BAFF
MADGKRFSTPKSRLNIERGSLQHPKMRYKKCIEEHPLNHSVQFVIPNTSLGNVLHHFQGITPKKDHFSLIEAPLHAFIETDFIKTFVKDGQFVALSWETRIDTGNCVAVLPNGTLILSLNKDTYEQLGLTGKPSAFQKKQRFIVEVDLKAPHFVPGKKNYDRVKWCLKENQPMTFKFLMSWTKAGRTSTDELHSYFSSCSCKRQHNSEDIKNDPTKAKAPIISFDRSACTDDQISTDNFDVCSCMALFDWLGGVACGISGLCAQPSQELVKLLSCQWTGMIMTDTILSMFSGARKVVTSQDVPWVAMTVWGFTDSPVTWKNNEHGHFLSGENFYTFVIFPDDNYWLFTAMGSNDISL